MSGSAAVVLLSGGLDSATCLAIAKKEGFQPHALSFRYGQRNIHEIEAAKCVAERARVLRHVILDIDLGAFGGSALTSDTAVPKHDSAADIGEGIPATYVPARNLIFLSLALAYAEVIPASHIFIGVNAVDYSGYPDCRPEFIRSFERTANLGTRQGIEGEQVKVRTPLMELSKAEIIRRGTGLGVDYAVTSSCYDPPRAGLGCGRCDACLLRRKGFREAGLSDPLRYQN